VTALLWSVRRELWEHRWLWRVPLVIGAIVISVFTGLALVQQMVGSGDAQAASRLLESRLSATFDLASRMLLMTGTIVAFVYCAEALNGERRDRAILFWKSWPVGDATAVAAKAMVALIVVPVMTVALLVAAQAIAWIVVRSRSVGLHAPLASPFRGALEVFAATLWVAPFHAWIMVVSAWARRAVLLLALLPVLLVAIVEVMFGGAADIGHAIFYRGVGRHWPTKLDLDSVSRGVMVARPAPELLRSPSLWVGLLLAVLLFALVARLRRRMMVQS
jgi:ABC-2 type transport system permease protein